MNLPQRKKSAEELAKLREELGVFVPPPAPPSPTPQAPPASAAPVAPPEISPMPSAPIYRGPKPVSSLRKSERVPLRPAASPPASFPPVADPLETPVVRSLRKSEQGPIHVSKPVATGNSHLPTQRHSDQDLNAMRQREAQAARMAPPPPKTSAPLLLLVFCYLLILGGAVLAWRDALFYVPAACEVAALLIAAFIFLKKPHSRHQAAIISILTLLITTFGALHYLPLFRHVP